MFKGADPDDGWEMTDPIYRGTPTLGACMSNIRRVVEKGDYIFSISGKVKNLKQYVVGGFCVEEKINALAAHSLFPENRMRVNENGKLYGNIAIDENGNQNEHDYHKLESCIENYIIGKDAIIIDGSEKVQKAREETLPMLNNLFGKDGETIFQTIGRGRKLDNSQIKQLLNWMDNILKS